MHNSNNNVTRKCLSLSVVLTICSSLGFPLCFTLDGPLPVCRPRRPHCSEQSGW